MTDSNDEYTKARDAAADDYAKSKHAEGMVDPGKWYAFAKGWDKCWPIAYERGKAEGREGAMAALRNQPDLAHELAETHQQLEAARAEARELRLEIDTRAKPTVEKLRKELTEARALLDEMAEALEQEIKAFYEGSDSEQRHALAACEAALAKFNKWKGGAG